MRRFFQTRRHTYQSTYGVTAFAFILKFPNWFVIIAEMARNIQFLERQRHLDSTRKLGGNGTETHCFAHSTECTHAHEQSVVQPMPSDKHSFMPTLFPRCRMPQL